MLTFSNINKYTIVFIQYSLTFFVHESSLFKGVHYKNVHELHCSVS